MAKVETYASTPIPAPQGAGFSRPQVDQTGNYLLYQSLAHMFDPLAKEMSEARSSAREHANRMREIDRQITGQKNASKELASFQAGLNTEAGRMGSELEARKGQYNATFGEGSADKAGPDAINKWWSDVVKAADNEKVDRQLAVLDRTNSGVADLKLKAAVEAQRFSMMQTGAELVGHQFAANTLAKNNEEASALLSKARERISESTRAGDTFASVMSAVALGASRDVASLPGILFQPGKTVTPEEAMSPKQPEVSFRFDDAMAASGGLKNPVSGYRVTNPGQPPPMEWKPGQALTPSLAQKVYDYTDRVAASLPEEDRSLFKKMVGVKLGIEKADDKLVSSGDQAQRLAIYGSMFYRGLSDAMAQGSTPGMKEGEPGGTVPNLFANPQQSQLLQAMRQTFYGVSQDLSKYPSETLAKAVTSHQQLLDLDEAMRTGGSPLEMYEQAQRLWISNSLSKALITYTEAKARGVPVPDMPLSVKTTLQAVASRSPEFGRVYQEYSSGNLEGALKELSDIAYNVPGTSLGAAANAPPSEKVQGLLDYVNGLGRGVINPMSQDLLEQVQEAQRATFTREGADGSYTAKFPGVANITQGSEDTLKGMTDRSKKMNEDLSKAVESASPPQAPPATEPTGATPQPSSATGGGSAYLPVQRLMQRTLMDGAPEFASLYGGPSGQVYDDIFSIGGQKRYFERRANEAAAQSQQNQAPVQAPPVASAQPMQPPMSSPQQAPQPQQPQPSTPQVAAGGSPQQSPPWLQQPLSGWNPSMSGALG